MKIPAALFTGLVILLAITMALLPYAPLPFPTSPLTQQPFSTGRAMQIIQHLSQSPRHVGAPGHAAARDYLVAELQAIGFTVEVQKAQVDGAPVLLENIVARLAGQSKPANAILLIAHYDSEKNSPGACDNASGVAVVLEIARSITSAGTLPANDLLILLSDGEELGVLGAPEFLAHHAWGQDVRIALNFDSLSVGPLMMWQTGQNNGWLVQQFATSAPQPMAASWVDGIARILPLGTDLEPFLKAGITGASFTTPYMPVQNHTPLDQIGVVTPAAIGFAGQQGSALVHHLVQSDLSYTAASEQLFFNLWGPLLIYYPANLSFPFAILTTLLFLAVAFQSLRLETVTNINIPWAGIASGCLFSTANLIFAALLQLSLEIIFFFIDPLLTPWIKIPISICLVVGPLLFGYRRLRRRYSQRAMLLGGQLVWLTLALWAGVSSPLFSALFTFILLVSLPPLAFETSPRFLPPVQRTARRLALIFILLLGAPPIYMLYMISAILWIPAVIGAMFIALLAALIFPLSENLPLQQTP